MNKTLLVAGGTALVSLAAGAAGGYFFAKKRFDEELPGIIENETEAIKKHYSLMLMEARNGKPSDPADLPRREDETEEGSELPDPDELSDAEQEELTGRDEAVIEKLRSNAKVALTDYQKISTDKVASQGVSASGKTVTKNIFADAESKAQRPLPPRGPGGKFRPRTAREENNDPPQIIDAETYLLNDSEHDQESLMYFVNDRTLVLTADPSEALDIALVGEVNLTLFPDVPEGQPSMIYVSNTGLRTDYEIKRMDESLTDFLGLGENSEEAGNPSAWV